MPLNPLIKSAFKKSLAKLDFFFEKMPFKVLVILVIFAILLWSNAYLEANTKRNAVLTLDEFFPFDYIYKDPKHITFNEGEITITASNNTWPTVQVYSGSKAFNWTFSVTPLVVIGNCQPIKAVIDWKNGSFILWANSTTGWGYNYHTDYENSTRRPPSWTRNPTITLNCKYTIEIEFKVVPKNVTINFAISNSTWSGQKTTISPIPLETDIRPDEVAIILQAFAYDNETQPYSKAIYDNSQIALDDFAELDSPSSYSLLISSVATTMIIIATIIVKLHSASITSSFQRKRRFIQSLNIKNLKSSFKIPAKSTRIVIVIFAFFAGLRIVLALTSSSHLFDSTVTDIWRNLIKTNGVLSIYSLSSFVPPFLGLPLGYPYPPIIAYTLSLLPYVAPQQNLAEFISKLPPITGDLLLGLVVFLALKSRDGLSIAIPALFLSLLNFVDSSIWGQYDSIVALFMVLAVWLVATKRTEMGWAFAALAICTKQTALVFLPGLLLLSIKQKSWSRLIYSFLLFFAVTFFVWFPFLANGFSFDFALSSTGINLLSPGGGMDPVSPRGGGGISIYAFNVWPLLTYEPGNLRAGIIGAIKDVEPRFLSLNYMQIGLILFFTAYLFIAIRIWKSSKPSDQMLNFGLLMLAFFMLPTRIHERYMVFALSFLPFAYKKSKVVLGSYLILLLTFWLNLEYALTTGVPSQAYSESLIFSEPGLLAIILINIAVFLLLFVKTSNIRTRKGLSSQVGQQTESTSNP